ncbi:uncharacterized protein SPSK_04695 [Sporothrix schenckii 1099-18]|uniref:Uncharacterized protein n=1 Tax=Sporothrix schenckii 1099-18 TaxID=1397361 RepID=A0A0F2M1V3_SPOSC|nr:uncharacterized protein SPSK_04695 [Sporothrix schenckii 1099-18]KJR83069.1 hypothetical protein SPSK_04695 [Sporothrix schenckii 1099-18]
MAPSTTDGCSFLGWLGAANTGATVSMLVFSVPPLHPRNDARSFPVYIAPFRTCPRRRPAAENCSHRRKRRNNVWFLQARDTRPCTSLALSAFAMNAGMAGMTGQHGGNAA